MPANSINSMALMKSISSTYQDIEPKQAGEHNPSVSPSTPRVLEKRSDQMMPDNDV